MPHQTGSTSNTLLTLLPLWRILLPLPPSPPLRLRQNENFSPSCMVRWSYPLLPAFGYSLPLKRSVVAGAPNALVVTTRLTPAMFAVLNRFFASKNSSPFIASRNGNEPRVAQVEIEDAAKPAGVALDIQRPIVVDAVLIQIQVRADVERETAVGLQDDPKLIVVEQHRANAAAAHRRREHGRHREGVGLVERRDALVAIEVRRIRDAVVLAADDVGAGERRVVLAARERVGRLRHPAVRHPLASASR